MFPVGDFMRTRTTPFVNWALIAVNIAVFVYMLTLSTQPDEIIAGAPFSEADRFIFHWGFTSPRPGFVLLCRDNNSCGLHRRRR